MSTFHPLSAEIGLNHVAILDHIGWCAVRYQLAVIEHAETVDELHRTFEDLRVVGCEVLTLGQYLPPTLADHAPVARYYAPEEFDELAELARRLGFLAVAAGPFVRSSYNAREVFEESRSRLAGPPLDSAQD